MITHPKFIFFLNEFVMFLQLSKMIQMVFHNCKLDKWFACGWRVIGPTNENLFYWLFKLWTSNILSSFYFQSFLLMLSIMDEVISEST